MEEQSSFFFQGLMILRKDLLLVRPIVAYNLQLERRLWWVSVDWRAAYLGWRCLVAWNLLAPGRSQVLVKEPFDAAAALGGEISDERLDRSVEAIMQACCVCCRLWLCFWLWWDVV